MGLTRANRRAWWMSSSFELWRWTGHKDRTKAGHKERTKAHFMEEISPQLMCRPKLASLRRSLRDYRTKVFWPSRVPFWRPHRWAVLRAWSIQLASHACPHLPLCLQQPSSQTCQPHGFLHPGQHPPTSIPPSPPDPPLSCSRVLSYSGKFHELWPVEGRRENYAQH